MEPAEPACRAAVGVVGRQIECYQPRAGHRLVRVPVDILVPVPVARLQITVESIRRGGRVELLQAAAQVEGRTVLIARAWRLIAASSGFPVAAVVRSGGADPAARDVELAAPTCPRSVLNRPIVHGECPGSLGSSALGGPASEGASCVVESCSLLARSHS